MHRHTTGPSLSSGKFLPPLPRPLHGRRHRQRTRRRRFAGLVTLAGWREDFEKFKAEKEKTREPVEAKVLNAVLSTSSTPYSLYVPSPRGILHGVHAMVKQAWLVVLLVLTARSHAPWAIAGGVALLTILALPPRLWTPQLKRLGLLALLIFVTTAVFAGGLPPVTQSQHLPHQLEGLPPLTPADDAYSHVLFHWLFITITRRSLQLATATSCLTFATLQSASLCLTTTPAEQLAQGLKMWLSPLGLLGVPVAEISLTLLLSLRFLAVVFEEVRNLALGLAARNIQWKAMGKGAGIQVIMRMLARLFSNLTTHSEHIAVAMKARGFAGPKDHQIAMGSQQESRVAPNVLAVLALLGLVAGSLQF